MSEWIEHDGSGMPVGPDVVVDVKFPDDYTVVGLEAKYWHDRSKEASNWIVPEWGNTGARIVAYRIVEQSDV